MSIYRGAGGSGDAVADSSSEALLIRDLAVEVQADADAASASATSASNSATSAASSATSAASSATSASSSATAAQTAETNAETAEANAETAEANAETAQVAAETAQAAAETAETNAETAASSATSSASSASTSASTATTQATNASNSATAAATSETNAASSASAAATSATNAGTSATSAAGSASAASTSASNASTSATNAATSETNAASSASTATTQAGIATTAATNAQTAETNAETAETNAAASASAASTSASNAATSATNASNSASSASTSATNAANSATLAASYTPSQTGNAGKYLTTDGTNTSWDGLATVANSGSYNDLSDKPTIPTNLDSLTDVTVTSPTTDQVLKYNGSNWVNGAAASSYNGMKNRLINAGFIINQRGYTSNTSLSSGTYAHDRWKAGSSGCTYTFTQGSNGVPITITITAGSLQQVIEGCNMPEGGTYVLSWEGTAQARFNGGTYGSSPLAVTGITAGANTTIEFNTGTVLKSQLEVGSSATGFEAENYTSLLAKCQRYYWRRDGSVTYNTVGCGVSESSTVVRIVISYPTTMRSQPTFSYGGTIYLQTNGLTSVSSINAQYATAEAGFVMFNAASAVTAGYSFVAFTNAVSSTHYFQASAEL